MKKYWINVIRLISDSFISTLQTDFLCSYVKLVSFFVEAQMVISWYVIRYFSARRWFYALKSKYREMIFIIALVFTFVIR